VIFYRSFLGGLSDLNRSAEKKMSSRAFWSHLVATWVAYVVASILWRFTFSAFIVPAYWRWEKEGRSQEWPMFARWTADLTVDWHLNHHLWMIAGALVSAGLFWAFRSKSRVRGATIARGACYAYLSVLGALSVSMGVISTL
jgi:hypothetical protein